MIGIRKKILGYCMGAGLLTLYFSLFPPHPVEQMVIQRLIHSRQAGIFSSSGLLAWPGFSPYRPYPSQIGGQGILFSGLDRVLPLQSLFAVVALFRGLTALLSSMVLMTIVFWFLEMFGVWTAAAVWSAVAFSPILVLNGSSLYWSLWAFYLPMTAVLYFFRSQPAPRRAFFFAGLVFASVFLKCFMNGYEYITATLVMMTVPILFYAVWARWPGRQILRYGLLAAAAAAAAVAFSLVILCVQIAALDGNWMDGFRSIQSALERRTYGNPLRYPAIAESLHAGTWEVVISYVKNYGPFLALFAAASAYVSWAAWKDSREEHRRRIQALVASTWFSILAPLSWFVLFKAHSFMHPHVDIIVWQMPFALFGFALCGTALHMAWRELR